MTFSVQLHYVLESFKKDKENILHLQKVYCTPYIQITYLSLNSERVACLYSHSSIVTKVTNLNFHSHNNIREKVQLIKCRTNHSKLVIDMHMTLACTLWFILCCQSLTLGLSASLWL